MEHLPEDIMHIIATKLEPYPKSLSRLCLVDKQTYSRLLGHLYRRVALANPHSIEIFCQSMCTSQYETSKLVRSLQMGVERRPPGLPKTPNVLVPGIQLALSKMELLEELLLYFYSIPVERILDNLVGPFHLKRFSGHCINSTATFSFLQTQPTITDLELYNDSETEDFCELLDKNPNVLQSLRRVKAHPDVLARLVPGRPVNQIALVGDLSLVPLLDLSPLARSTMPITSIYFQEFGRTRAGLRHLVASLKSARITSHVEQLTMMEMSARSNYLTNTTHPRQMLIMLSEFQSLNRLVVRGASDILRSKDETRQWLGSMTAMSEWQQHVKALKQVSIWGVDIE